MPEETAELVLANDALKLAHIPTFRSEETTVNPIKNSLSDKGVIEATKVRQHN